MSIVIKTKWIVGAVIIAILALFITGYVLGHKKADRASQAAKQALNKEISRLTVEINDQTVYITSIEQELKTERQARKDSDISREELRKLNLKQANEITRLKLRVDTLLEDVEHNGQIIHIDTVTIEGNPANAILLPFSFTKKDEYLQLNGTFNSQGKLDISLKIDVPLDIWTGISKETKKPICIATSKNEYINVLSISSLKLDTQKPKRYGIGIMAGYGINLSGTVKANPVLGVGISYNVIRF
jgi:hypothetical protein